MGYWIDENTYQFEDDQEFADSIGIDLDTKQGDYAENFHHIYKNWYAGKTEINFKLGGLFNDDFAT